MSFKKSLFVGSATAVLFVTCFSSTAFSGNLREREVYKDDNYYNSVPSRGDLGRGRIGTSPGVGRGGGRDMDINLRIPFQNVDRFHARVLCGEGETKKLYMGGVQDNFSFPMDPYVNSQPLGLNPNNNQPFPNTGGYDSTHVNRHFFDRLTIPSEISQGYLLFALRYNGYVLQDNDTIFFGDQASRSNPSTSQGFSTNLQDLETWGFNLGFQRLGSLGGANGAIFRASLAEIPLLNGGSLLDYIQSGNGATHVDTYLQDDTSIDFIAYSVCVREPKAVVNSEQGEGKDITIDSHYGPLEIKEYCQGTPIKLPTAGTTPAYNYWVHLQTFDPVGWQGISDITPASNSGWQCANNQICPAPNYLLASDYNNPAGQNLSANLSGEIYHLKFAIGAVWAEAHHFFRVRRCLVVDDNISVGRRPRL